MSEIPKLDLKKKVSAEEWQVRLDLAACYRLVAHFGWDDLIYTHISARVPDTETYLVNPYGLRFDEVTASNLVRVNLKGEVIGNSPFPINPAGFTIHSAIHEVRHDAACVMHLHTNATVAVASLQDGLLPISQYAMFILPSLSYHDYEGLAVESDEKKRLQEDLGESYFMLLRNHGGLTLGPSIGDAFMHMYDLMRACEIQLMIQSTGQTITPIPDEIVQNICQQASVVNLGSTGGQIAWPAMYRKAKQIAPDFEQ
ncbi:class II aldolase/adducin family protein [Algicola sagamiensis]|uniref:class II aldolase/adducin family protein n=1 Tax=Algicola sagamiensis TaxID=163869 RepID=UPI0004771571|nr:class II aldolase/adducin family protein [Algicola sagamiensis]